MYLSTVDVDGTVFQEMKVSDNKLKSHFKCRTRFDKHKTWIILFLSLFNSIYFLIVFQKMMFSWNSHENLKLKYLKSLSELGLFFFLQKCFCGGYQEFLKLLKDFVSTLNNIFFLKKRKKREKKNKKNIVSFPDVIKADMSGIE